MAPDREPWPCRGGCVGLLCLLALPEGAECFDDKEITIVEYLPAKEGIDISSDEVMAELYKVSKAS